MDSVSTRKLFMSLGKAVMVSTLFRMSRGFASDARASPEALFNFPEVHDVP